ncbi:putative phage abortive infection protein [Marseilla massiliensis]|uniref:Phage abortive infection protein n=1 Tax=Marseilla massiliensis TaxID=1841864 RepID=A0A939B5H2_9BACT|nr:putative phage abortive infection protein [Marseilla massiliensis]MBM6662067.1 putative phage abortive infection protein [Marseilla massiliensis]
MKSIKIAIIFCAGLSLAFLVLFLINRQYDYSWPLATDIVGHYGDFIGGFVGSLLSVVLLYYTFRSQIAESKENAKVYIKQQFNETFFHLLHQYNSIVETFSARVESEETALHGKEALHYYVQQMQTEFDNGEFYENRKEAVGCFMNFYAAHEDFTPIYYRTLYRIFDMIETTNIDDDEKVKYAKIVRSQLTDSELVLLRYNAMTAYGRKMRKYVVNYNLLKHMPAMGLLEYRKWRKMLTQSMQNKLNVVLYLLRKNIHDLEPNQPTLAHTSSRAKYHVNVTMKDEGREVKIDFHRNLNSTVLGNDEFSCFETMPLSVIGELLEEWLKEIFIFSLLGIKEKKNKVLITKKIDTTSSKEHLTISVNSKTKKPLNVCGKTLGTENLCHQPSA